MTYREELLKSLERIDSNIRMGELLLKEGCDCDTLLAVTRALREEVEAKLKEAESENENDNQAGQV